MLGGKRCSGTKRVRVVRRCSVVWSECGRERALKLCRKQRTDWSEWQTICKIFQTKDTKCFETPSS